MGACTKTDEILIVDDSLTVRMDLAEAFEASGYGVIACGSIAQAREALKNATVKLIVLDVVLPDGDGIELMAELTDAGPLRPIVLLLSSEVDVADRLRGLRRGADEYVGKPYDKGYVIAKAGELLRSRARQEVTTSPSALVIDDSEAVREQLRSVLAGAGYRVLTASSGEEGLRIAADRRPSAVLVDGQLPGIDGATVIRRIRLDEALRGTPCLLVTGSEDRSAELRALDAGADAFVRKDERFEIVLAKLAAVLRRAPPSARAEGRSTLGPKRVLAVDDSPTYLHEVARSLAGEGYDLVLARSGEEALELLAVQAVDCILLDLVMPGLGGRETCRRIKAAPGVRDIPLILLTALDAEDAMIDGFAAGADDYISKSSEVSVLRARVRAQIRRKQFEDEARRMREELLRREIEASEERAARELAETRAALVDELARKNQELEAFSYSVSHDLHAPLRSIRGFSDILLEDYAEVLDERGQDCLRRVTASAKRMGELIDDLLALSRWSRTTPHVEETSLSEVALTVATTLTRSEPNRAVQVSIQPDVVVRADPRLLRIVLDNLLGNAWKFTRETSAPRIDLDRVYIEEEAVYRIRDNGAGFDMRQATKLFNAFQRLHSEAEFPGTGIGLATARRVIERHGGRIWAEGVRGSGATFYFTLESTQGRR